MPPALFRLSLFHQQSKERQTIDAARRLIQYPLFAAATNPPLPPLPPLLLPVLRGFPGDRNIVSRIRCLPPLTHTYTIWAACLTVCECRCEQNAGPESGAQNGRSFSSFFPANYTAVAAVAAAGVTEIDRRKNVFVAWNQCLRFTCFSSCAIRPFSLFGPIFTLLSPPPSFSRLKTFVPIKAANSGTATCTQQANCVIQAENKRPDVQDS